MVEALKKNGIPGKKKRVEAGLKKWNRTITRQGLKLWWVVPAGVFGKRGPGKEGASKVRCWRIEEETDAKVQQKRGELLKIKEKKKGQTGRLGSNVKDNGVLELKCRQEERQRWVGGTHVEKLGRTRGVPSKGKDPN